MTLPANKWLLPYSRNKRNYENIGCLPYALEHDRGFAGDKLYRLVRRLPDGDFVRLLDGLYYNRNRALRALRIHAASKGA